MRQPENFFELRTKYSSPVFGSNAACDSNNSLETPWGVQRSTCSGAGAALTAPNALTASRTFSCTAVPSQPQGFPAGAVLVPAPAQAGPENSASIENSTASLTPMVEPGCGIPNAMPKSERLSVPWAVQRPTARTTGIRVFLMANLRQGAPRTHGDAPLPTR